MSRNKLNQNAATASHRSHRMLGELLEYRRLLSTISFAPHVDFASGTSPVALVAADFNQDGDQDLAVADDVTDKVYVYFGNGAGAFSTGPVLSLSSPPTAIIAGDFNGDGKQDIAVATTAGVGQTTTVVDVFLNTGSGTFGVGQITTLETDATPGEYVDLVAADFNRDGHLDLAVTEYADQSVAVLLGNGAGSFASPITYNLLAHPTAITSADFNDDGNPDLAVTSTLTDYSSGSPITTNNLSLLLGSSSSDFSAGPNIQLSTGGIPTSVAPADLTTAVTPGLIVGDSNGNGSLFTNTSGTFTAAAIATLAAGSTGLAVGDFAVDGSVDFVSSDGGSATSVSTNTVTVTVGTGNGTIAGSGSFATGSHPSDVVVADFNNDGKPDIATANSVAGTVSILLNTTVIPPIATRTALAVSAASTPAGSVVTLTATITAGSVSPLTNEEVPGGSINFYDGTTLLSTVSLPAATTTVAYATSSLTLGAHKLHAVYSGDDAYSSSNSVTTIETITPTATEGPDLIGTFVGSSFPAIVAPGETGTISVRVTNQGNTNATGAIIDPIYLSLDSTLDAGDTLLTARGALAHASLHLKPNQSVLLTATVTIPQSIALANYYILIPLNSSASLAESVTTNNLVASPSTYSAEDVFGNVGGRKAISLEVSDNNGTPATFRLTGPGNGTINIGDDGIDLVLSATTPASLVTITTAGSAIFQLHEVNADSAVGSLKLIKASVSHSIALPGGATSIALANLGTAGDAGDTMTIGGGTISTITIGSVPAANLTTTGGIRALSVNNWGSGEVTAAWISSLRSRQNFTPGLSLSGTGAPAGVALGSVSIGGTAGNASADWSVDGVASRVNAAGFAAGWTLDVTGLLSTFASTAGFSGSISAANIGSISIRGGLTDSKINSASSIRTITVDGPVDSATRFTAAIFPRKAIVGGAAVDPVTDPNFETG